MKRWIWLLAVPWAVQIATHPACPDCPAITKSCEKDGVIWCACMATIACGTTDYFLTYNGKPSEDCRDESFCADKAEALNEAHERITGRQSCSEVCGIVSCGSETFVNGKWYQGIVPEYVMKEAIIHGCHWK